MTKYGDTQERHNKSTVFPNANTSALSVPRRSQRFQQPQEAAFLHSHARPAVSALLTLAVPRTTASSSSPPLSAPGRITQAHTRSRTAEDPVLQSLRPSCLSHSNLLHCLRPPQGRTHSRVSHPHAHGFSPHTLGFSVTHTHPTLTISQLFIPGPLHTRDLAHSQSHSGSLLSHTRARARPRVFLTPPSTPRSTLPASSSQPRRLSRALRSTRFPARTQHAATEATKRVRPHTLRPPGQTGANPSPPPPGQLPPRGPELPGCSVAPSPRPLKPRPRHVTRTGSRQRAPPGDPAPSGGSRRRCFRALEHAGALGDPRTVTEQPPAGRARGLPGDRYRGAVTLTWDGPSRAPHTVT